MNSEQPLVPLVNNFWYYINRGVIIKNYMMSHNFNVYPLLFWCLQWCITQPYTFQNWNLSRKPEGASLIIHRLLPYQIKSHFHCPTEHWRPQRLPKCPSIVQDTLHRWQQERKNIEPIRHVYIWEGAYNTLWSFLS